jgi:LysM repeat protein
LITAGLLGILLTQGGCRNWVKETFFSPSSAMGTESEETEEQPLPPRPRVTPRRPSWSSPGPEDTVPTAESHIPVAPLPDFDFSPRSDETHYTVRKGDTLSSIARRYGVSVHRIAEINRLSGDRIFEKQVLILPGNLHKANPSDKKATTVGIDAEEDEDHLTSADPYTVQKGDFLAKISRKTGVKVETLMELNGISDPRTLQVGQKLILRRQTDSTFTTSPRISTPSHASAFVIVSEKEKETVPTPPPAAFEEESSLENNVEDLFEDTNAIPVVPIEEEEED